MPDKYVWIIGGGLLQVPAVEAARSLGLGVIVSDRNPRCACADLADTFLPIDTYNINAHVAYARSLVLPGIVGVFTEGADVEETVAAVAAVLGVPRIDPKAARACHDKAEMRAAFAERGVSPIGWSILPPHGFEQYEPVCPVVVKPSDNCASRGVHVVRDAAEFQAAVDDARANGRKGAVLLEEYLEGPQQSVEILFDADGCVHYLNIVDRIFDGALELGHVNPTALGEPEREALFMLTVQAARACGVGFGAFKADTIWTAKGPRILEVTARLSGGFDCQYTTPLATGRNFIRAALALACGLPIPEGDLTAKHQRYAAAWAAFPKPGKVVNIGLAIHDPDEVEFLRVGVGDVIQDYRHCADRPGFAIVAADTYAGALEQAQAAAKALAERIVTA